MSGETSGISQFFKLEWFKQVIFQDETAPFPDNVLKQCLYIGPSLDVGQAMTAKILTQNGQGHHRLTYKLLNPDEIADKDGSDAQERFMARVCEKLESQVQPKEFEDKGLENTPQYNLYKH